MIKKNPAIIDVFNTAKEGFTFAVKEGMKNYSVYDRVHKRELAAIEEDKENIKLQAEILDMYEMAYKRVSDTRLEVFNPEFEEYEDLELPLYRKGNSRLGRAYVYMNTTTLLKHVPTKKMVEESKKYLLDFKQRVVRDALRGKVEIGIEHGCDLVSTIVETDCKITSCDLDLEKYYLFSIKEPYKGMGRYVTLVIDKKKANEEAVDGVLRIVAPKDVVGIIIGKAGRCTKAMAKELGFKYIDVKAY